MFRIEIKGRENWVAPAALNRLHPRYQGAPLATIDMVPPCELIHVALVFDGTHATGYVNGIDSLGPQPVDIGVNVAAPVIIGATKTGGRVLRGLLDGVRICDYPFIPAGAIGTIGVDLGYKPFW